MIDIINQREIRRRRIERENQDPSHLIPDLVPDLQVLTEVHIIAKKVQAEIKGIETSLQQSQEIQEKRCTMRI